MHFCMMQSVLCLHHRHHAGGIKLGVILVFRRCHVGLDKCWRSHDYDSRETLETSVAIKLNLHMLWMLVSSSPIPALATTESRCDLEIELPIIWGRSGAGRNLKPIRMRRMLIADC